MKVIESILNTGRDRLKNENFIINEIDDFIPLKTVEKFYEFEDKLNDKRYLQEVAKFMRGIGGSETHELVHNILKRFMSNQLATFFNLQDKNLKKDETQAKIAFINTNLFNCIIRAVHLRRNNVDEKKYNDKVLHLG